MRKPFLLAWLCGTAFIVVGLISYPAAQDALSAQVLRLLDRANTWSEPQTLREIDESAYLQGLINTTYSAGQAWGWYVKNTGELVLDGAVADALSVDPTTNEWTLPAVKISTVHTSAPAGSACDAAGETGRISWDSTNDFLYICSGASGWRKFTSAAP